MSLASQLSQMSQSLADNRRLHLTEITADAPEAQTTVGGLLRAARMRAGEELAQVGRDLRIKPAYLEALEEGRPQDLPGRAYAIGFLRTYADYLGLDVGECLGRFKSEFPETSEAVSATPATSTYKIEDEVRLPHGTILVFLTLICMAIYGGWYLFRSANEVLETRVRPVPEALVAPQEAAPAPPAAIGTQIDPIFMPEDSDVIAPSPVFEAPAVETDGASPAAAEAAEGAEPAPAPAADPTPETAATPATESTPTPEPVAEVAPPQETPVEGPVAEAPADAAPPASEETAAPVGDDYVPANVGPIVSAPLPTVETPTETPSETAAEGPTVDAAPAPAQRDFGEVVAEAGRTFGAPTRDNRVVLRAEEEVFVRVETEGGSGVVLFEGMLQPGELYFVPVRDNVVLVTRNGGAVEVFVDRVSRGDAGPGGVALKGLPLDPEKLGR